MLHDDNCTSSIKDISPGVNIELARDAGSSAIVFAQFRQFFGNFFFVEHGIPLPPPTIFLE